MILVDSSVWINFLRATETSAVRTLRRTMISDAGQVLLGDMVLLEVLQGARDDNHAARIEGDLRTFPLVNLLDRPVAVLAARNFRVLRGLGVTLRGVADLMIGTYCLLHGHALLYDDRDFDPMVNHLGLLQA